MERHYVWTVPTAVVAVLALILSLNALGQSPGAGSQKRSSGPRVLDVTLADLKIEPATLRAAGGEPLRLRVRNRGAVQHNLAVAQRDVRTRMLGPGEEATVDLGVLPPGTYTLFCEVAGHREAGMEASLVVGEGASQAAMSPQEMDEAYMAGVKAFPASTRGVGGQRLEPRIEGGVKVFELTAAEVDWEVAPGDVKRAMAYNGMVPGPEIRVRVGDRVRVVLHNRLRESTSIHFHGLHTPNDQDGVPGITQDLVKPGQDYTYEFTVRNAGSHMYHSHMNGANQIPRGLLGAFVVEGPDEPRVDLDQVLVLNDGPLGYTINGKSFPATQPIVARPGQRVRIRYMNEGLQGHPMHLHGMPQTVIARDGYPLPAPYTVDTLWVAPGERYDVLVEAREGVWAFHCHILSHAENERGMFGMVTAVVVK